MNVIGMGSVTPARTNCGPWRSLENVRDLCGRPSARVGGVHLNDAITLDHTSLLGGCVREDALNGYEALHLADFHPDAAVLAAGLGIEGGKLLG